MRYLILLFLLVSCNPLTPEEKAKKLINENLKLTLHDYKSYEPVKLGPIDSSYTDWTNVPEYLEFEKKAKEWGDKMNEYGESQLIYVKLGTTSYREYKKTMNEYLDSATYYINANKKIIDTTQIRFEGWQTLHTFRAKNLGGNIGIHYYRYWFDKDFKEVIRVKEISE